MFEPWQSWNVEQSEEVSSTTELLRPEGVVGNVDIAVDFEPRKPRNEVESKTDLSGRTDARTICLRMIATRDLSDRFNLSKYFPALLSTLVDKTRFGFTPMDIAQSIATRCIRVLSK
jgi:hypothetical protein